MTMTPAQKETLYLLPYIGLLILVALLAVYALTMRPPPSLTYTATVYFPVRTVYAPGETLAYTATLDVAQPGSIDIRRGFRTQPSHAWARLCDGAPSRTIAITPPPFPDNAVGIGITQSVTVTVPLLPPGSYELTSSASNGRGGESTYRVPFQVMQPCP